MRLSSYFLKKIRNKGATSITSTAATSSSVLAVAACGGGSGVSDTQPTGFPNSYIEPVSNYVAPTDKDPNFETLKPAFSNPYWVAALEMDQWNKHITPMIENFQSVIHYSFPAVPPEYDTYGLTGWAPATEEIKSATRDILGKFEDILNVTFSESNELNAINVISVSTSDQVNTAGFSYFPNNFFQIGMDVFIADDYANPSFLNEQITNYDYEVLVHELGHALGLKHPFEAHLSNTAILSTYEDNTGNTAMSYDEDPASYNGTLRSLDWMALAKFYGVNPTYNGGDDTYGFSASGGIFILDGGGTDTIAAYDTPFNVTIDMRPGAHSYLGSESDYITASNQLTISHGSNIENVVTGVGDDTVIGTDSNNFISTGSGSDTIFAGAGADIIKSGTGADRIDLSESVPSRDTVILDALSADLGVDTIYGFSQGKLGDIFDVSDILTPVFELFPLVISGSSPTANFSEGILRLTGPGVSSATDLSTALEVGGGLETLSMANGSSALIISADSQATGEDQIVFSAESSNGEISVSHLATLLGNDLDIDQWHMDNFIYIA